MSKRIDIAELDKLENLAREAHRTAIGEISGTTSSGRALEALKEFRNACSPQLMIDLITAWHAAYGPIDE